MANTLSKTGISNGSTVTAAHVTQSIDAFTGIEAYDITVSGSMVVVGPTTVSALTAAGLIYPTADGTSGNHITTDGAGNLTFGYSNVTGTVKNISGGTLTKGTPVYVSSSSGLDVNEVLPSSASVSSTMPAVFILEQDLNDQATGLGILTGFITGVDTSTFTEGEIVYVGANGGYTNIKPTGSNLIQNLGVVTKVHASNGSGFITSNGRSNDVPNLLDGNIFYGSGSISIQTPLSTLISESNYNYSGSFQGDGSGVTGVVSASYATNAASASYAPSSTPSLDEVLAQGTSSGAYNISMDDNQQIQATNGGGMIDLRYTADGAVGISTDNNAYSTPYIYIDKTQFDITAASASNSGNIQTAANMSIGAGTLLNLSGGTVNVDASSSLILSEGVNTFSMPSSGGELALTGSITNFADTDLTLTGARTHTTDGNSLTISSDGGTLAKSWIIWQETRNEVGFANTWDRYSSTSKLSYVDNTLISELSNSGSLTLNQTQSTIPAWTGTDGEIVPATVGGNHFLYMWMGGAWRSGSFV